MKGALGIECFSLKRLSAEGLWGGLLYWGCWKICQERLWIQASISIGAPLGNLEGILLLGLFERKEKYIWVPFLDPDDIKNLSLGAIWNLGKGTGLS